MKHVNFPLAAVLLLLSVSGADASTLVDLVCWAEVLHVGGYDQDSGVMDVVVRFHGVDMESSATDYFADSFMEYEGSSKNRISLEGISADEAALISCGCMITVDYWSVSCILVTEEGDWEGYSDESWTFAGMGAGSRDLPVDSPVALI